MLAIFLASFFLLCAGTLAGLLAWVLAHFVKKSADGRINIREGGFLVKAVFVMALAGGGLLGLAVVGFFVSAVWWVLSVIDLTPGRLALLSILIGVFPMVLALLGVGLAKISGGHVDASESRGCFFLGFDLNNLVYTLFMCHWAVIFTGGFAVFGLLASGLWALFT